MKNKTIQEVFTPPAAHMVGDGFKVHNFFPGGNKIGIQRMSPFFLMDYNAKTYLPPSDKPRGVGVHPHRGFETVTIAYHGKVAHHDSAGNSGVIGEGDVQWMTAGSGVLHKEYHEKAFSKAGGDFQMVQLWVNLPAKDKMHAPKYQEITRANMGVYAIDDKGSVVEVIAGKYKDVTGAASTFTPVELYTVKLKKNAVADFSLPEHYNTGLLIIEGNVVINGDTKAPESNFVLFNNDGEDFTIEASEDAVVLLLSGEPINERIFAYGPFLMNSREEIEQAYSDYNLGKFGYLEED
ncbi:pirin family protein [Terrimonas rubra]|uniref:Pirin family protein n=1 Tax=Terrimonas rubra TaxID=1035890 RepID=A0ABW6A1R0_9BACT